MPRERGGLAAAARNVANAMIRRALDRCLSAAVTRMQNTDRNTQQVGDRNEAPRPRHGLRVNSVRYGETVANTAGTTADEQLARSQRRRLQVRAAIARRRRARRIVAQNGPVRPEGGSPSRPPLSPRSGCRSALSRSRASVTGTHTGNDGRSRRSQPSSHRAGLQRSRLCRDRPREPDTPGSSGRSRSDCRGARSCSRASVQDTAGRRPAAAGVSRDLEQCNLSEFPHAPDTETSRSGVPIMYDSLHEAVWGINGVLCDAFAPFGVIIPVIRGQRVSTASTTNGVVIPGNQGDSATVHQPGAPDWHGPSSHTSRHHEDLANCSPSRGT